MEMLLHTGVCTLLRMLLLLESSVSTAAGFAFFRCIANTFVSPVVELSIRYQWSTVRSMPEWPGDGLRLQSYRVLQ